MFKNISSESVHTWKLGKKEQPDVIKNSEGENLEVFWRGGCHAMCIHTPDKTPTDFFPVSQGLQEYFQHWKS